MTFDPSSTDLLSANRFEPLSLGWRVLEVCLLVGLFCIFAGEPAPMVNEAHYLVKAKNFWNPDWCQHDLFAASGKAHTTFYYLFGWPTLFWSLSTTAWIGRIAGWLAIAIGLQSLTIRLTRAPLACLAVAIIWIVGVEYGNLAGEWVIGGIEAKVPAYGFVLLAISRMIDHRWNQVWILLGIASAFHVLSGGWSVIAASVVWLLTQRNHEERHAFFSPGLFIGGAIALLGLVPALALTVGADPQESIKAAHTYTYFRIKHHLLPVDFKFAWYLRHGLMIAASCWLYRQSQRNSQRQSTAAGPRGEQKDGEQRGRGGFQQSQEHQAIRVVACFALGAVCIAVVGLFVGLLPPFAPDLAAKVLRYYWFRLTDAAVPLFAGLVVTWLVINGDSRSQSFAKLALAAGVLAFGYSSFTKWNSGIPPSSRHQILGYHVNDSADTQRNVFADWLAVCRWAKHATPENEIFLTPRHQQTFKWYAHRAEVVNWKDVPQDAESLVEWRRRFAEVYPRWLSSMRVTIKHSTLRRFRTEYGVRFMIVDQRIVDPQLQNVQLPLVRVYPIHPRDNQTYAVYELPFPID